MIHLDSFKIAIPLKKKFAVAGGEATVKTNLLTVLNNRYNGEASPSVKYGPSMEDLQADIQKGLELLSTEERIDVEVLTAIDEYDIHPVARSALMAMALNYISGETGRYPWEVLSLGSPVGIKSSVTVAIDTPSEMIEAIKNCEYNIVKVKMGHEEDILLLDALAKINDKEIRVDANGGWSCAKAEEMIHRLAEYGVRIIEQPTDEGYVKEWKHLKGKHTEVELIMDEGLGGLLDYSEHAALVDGVNIKMEKCGGILEGIKLARQARRDKKKVMLGCMVGSSVGIAQSVYMSSQADYFDLDGPLLLENDIARGIRYDRESIEVDREMIGGPRLKRDVVEKYIQD
ncbi:MAG: hypothetical protein KAW91_04155 [candidate division Zixibacteria bacterium]|nr:hypothetical protein [candidate division Zixibacteria bacterium]